MTATIRPLRDAEELEALWPQIWPMLDALDQHHASLIGKPLRDGRQERAHQKQMAHMQQDRFWFLVAEEAGALVGISTGEVLNPAFTVPGPAGHMTNSYIMPAARSQGLYHRFSEAVNDLFISVGVRVREATILAINERMVEIRRSFIHAASWKRPVRDLAPEKPSLVRRIKDLESEWPQVWRLIQRPGYDEALERARVERMLENRGIILAVGDPAVAVLTGRVAVNPWIFEERLGAIADLVVADGEDPGLADILIDRIEGWAISKRAESLLVRPVRIALSEEWRARGFVPHMYQTQQLL